MAAVWEAVTTSPEGTQQIARALGAACSGGELFLLQGDVGTGKTCFVQGLAQGLEVSGYVHSPTFVLVAEYPGRLPLYHVDLYRIESDAEAAALGLDEYFGGDGVCAVEWAGKTPSLFPEDHLLGAFEDLGGDRRRISLAARGPRHAALLASLDRVAARGTR